MGEEQNIIVALEFGSSAICGMAGVKKPDGTLKILGVEMEKTAESVQRGVIYNIDTTTQAIVNIIDRLSEKLGTRINKAYVGISGQSLHTVRNVISRSLETKVKITNELMDNLMDNNLATQYPEAEILDVVPQEYIVGLHSVINPVGIQGDQIEAHYLNVVAKRAISENIKKCMTMAGLEIADMFISPVTLGNTLLSESDKRSGCALVDFGAETTTVSVYTSNILRHMAVIPIGGHNITMDLVKGEQMYIEEAESIKRKFGVAYVTRDTENPHMISISSSRTLSENDLQTIICARQEEIIKNAWSQIEAFADQLLAGIITTGAASQIKDMTEAIKHHTNFDRVKAAKMLVTNAEVTPGVNTPQNTSIDTLIALVLNGEANCAGESISSTVDVDPDDGTEEENPTAEGTASTDQPAGTDQAEEKPDEEPEKKGKKPKRSFLDKARTAGRWLISIVQEPEEDDEEEEEDDEEEKGK